MSHFPEFDEFSKKKGLILHRLSYFCANLKCIECPGTISYKKVVEITGFRGTYDEENHKITTDGKFHGQYRDAQTGEMVGEKEFEDWDVEHSSIQLANGEIQNPRNTPEGTQCECMLCHGRPGYDEWKARGGAPKERKQRVKTKPKKREFTDKEKSDLK